MTTSLCSNDMPTLQDSMTGTANFIIQLAEEVRQSTSLKTFAITG